MRLPSLCRTHPSDQKEVSSMSHADHKTSLELPGTDTSEEIEEPTESDDPYDDEDGDPEGQDEDLKGEPDQADGEK